MENHKRKVYIFEVLYSAPISIDFVEPLIAVTTNSYANMETSFLSILPLS